MDLRILVKNVYGTKRFYPACEKSMLVAKMFGQKTISESKIKILEELGCGIQLKGWTGDSIFNPEMVGADKDFAYVCDLS